jgi:2C-methyl-D-erythritol 2,4-cyclodiphosphate synthase
MISAGNSCFRKPNIFNNDAEKDRRRILFYENEPMQLQKSMKLIRQLPMFLPVVILSACATCKIEPPPTVIGTDREGAAKVAASALGSSISGAEISGNIKSVVNSTYVTVAQDDVAFYLLLQAYNCESKRGHLKEADALLVAAREELARRHNAPVAAVTANPTALTSTENKVLSSATKEETKAAIASKPQ